MIIAGDVLKVEGWKRFVSDSIAKLYAVATALVDVYNKASSVGGKYFYEVDELMRKALISGMQSDGAYAQNALAMFYKDVLGISLEDSGLLVRLLQSGRQPTVKVVVNAPGFWRYIANIQRISEFIISRFGVEASPVKIERPGDLYDRFLEFLNLAANLLPQYNQYSFLAFTLAQNTYRYLAEISKPENDVYPGLLENKDLLDMLGVAKIVEMPEDMYSLWGYSDHLVYDSKSGTVLGFQLDNAKTLRTIGGAMCRLIENIFVLFGEIGAIDKWYKNMPKYPEIEYVEFALKSIKGAELENPLKYTEPCPIEKLRMDQDYCLRSLYNFYIIDDDYICRRSDTRRIEWGAYTWYYRYGIGELRNKFSLWEYLDNSSLLMFLGVLYVIFIEPMRKFMVLVRPRKDTFEELYKRHVLGGAHG